MADDKTRIKLLEKELSEAREELETKTAELRRTVYRLEEAGRLQEQFVANITHELRTPLTTILVTSEVIERYMGPSAPPNQRHQLELIRRNAKLLEDLINDLLDLARLKRHQLEPRCREFPLRRFIDNLRESMAPLFQHKELSFEVRLADNLPQLICSDEEMLRKILANLLSNAYKFTEKGGVIFAVNRNQAKLVFSVADTGPGIPAESLPRIFEEFRQLDGSDSRRHSGTGLGLSISDRMAGLLGAKIEVESAVGKGSVFSVVLPIGDRR
jgi:signal transduction histidine kinase